MRVKRPPLPPGLTYDRRDPKPPDLELEVAKLIDYGRMQAAHDIDTYAATTRISAEGPGLAVAAEIARRAGGDPDVD